jgi:hypothetical protein
MWVEPELLHSGGAAALSAAPIGSNIFGDFDAARSFHQRLSALRTSRVEAMRGNHRTLTDVGRKVQTGAGWFSQTEHQNTEDVSRITDG